MQELERKLIGDLQAVGLSTDFTLKLRPYSKSFFGRYCPRTKTIFIYIYQDRQKSKLYPYSNLFCTTLHEAVHHKQWNSPFFVRKKGVMHDVQFKNWVNQYLKKASELNIINGGTYVEKSL